MAGLVSNQPDFRNMKKKESPPKAAKAHASPPIIICSVCAKKPKLYQQENPFVLHIGKEQIKIEYWKLLRITVIENYCYLHVRSSGKLQEVKQYPIKSTLLSWKHLEDHGLTQVTPSCILNLAHVDRVVKDELYSKYLDKGIEVTEKHKHRVAEMLPLWSGLQLISRKRAH